MSSLTVGTSVELKGTLAKSRGKEQAIELAVETVRILGPCDPFVSLMGLVLSYTIQVVGRLNADMDGIDISYTEETSTRTCIEGTSSFTISSWECQCGNAYEG
jgi:hypothetical protein